MLILSLNEIFVFFARVIAAAVLSLSLICGAAPQAGAFDLVTFDNDIVYLNQKYYLGARHYEVIKIIPIDNTDENLILAPSSLRYDKKYNRLLVGDYLSGKIRKYSLNNYKYSGDFAIEKYGKKLLGNPADIFISPDSRNYVVIDQFFNRMVFFNSLGMNTNITGGLGEAMGEFSEPCAVAFSGGRFFVADKYNCRICVFDASGYFKYSFASKGTADSQLYLPTAVKANSSGEVYVCDSGNDRIQVFEARGRYIKTIGRRGRSPGFFDAPSDICFDANSNIYVADANNKRVQKFSPAGDFLCEIKALESSFLSEDYKPDFYFKMPKNFDSNEINFSLGSLAMPVKIDLNNETAHLYVLDSEQKKIFILDCDNFNKGRRLYLDRNFKDAIKYLKIVMEENPGNLNALYYLGFCYQQTYDYKKAYECYDKIIKVHSLSEVEKHARYQLKKMASVNPSNYFDVAAENNGQERKRSAMEVTYNQFMQSAFEPTAFDRKRKEHFAKYGIEPPATEEVKVEKDMFIDYDDE